MAFLAQLPSDWLRKEIAVDTKLTTPDLGPFSATLIKTKLANPDKMGTGRVSVSTRMEQGRLETGTGARPQGKDLLRGINVITGSLILSCSSHK